MDAEFWIKAWKEGRTNFHQSKYNDKLLEYFPGFQPQPAQNILVPLCGKTKDMVWLHYLKLNVHGIELHEEAVRSFFEENNLIPFNESKDEIFKNFQYQNICISCGDFFKLSDLEFYDYIYDRASLVALPEDMRKNYSEVIKRSLKPGGKYLLIVYEYDQSKMEGPPFSVNEKEIQDLYCDTFEIRLVESLKPSNEGGRLSALNESLKQNVYILHKRVK